MEKWQEIFAGKIPQDNYQTQILNGEKQGLIVELYGSHFCVIIKFGMIQAMRMLDEGIVQDNLYSKNEIKRYKDNNFRNVIYEIKEGEFGKQINAISNGYAECLRLKHYIVITQNYNIDVVTEWEPIIEISQR